MTSYNKSNKFAKKYDFETSLEFMNKALKKLKADPEIRFIGTLAVVMDKEKNIFNYLVDTYDKKSEYKNESGPLLKIRKQINTIIESRLVSDGLKGDINASLTKFCLQNFQQKGNVWQERVHNEVESSVISINIDAVDKEL